MALILEVLDVRAGGVRARVRLDALPLRIGRSLDNDLILDDPYVDARHAHITREDTGEVVVEDLGSTNGMLAVRSGGRVVRIPAQPGTELRVGRTTLRFRDSAEPVAPTLHDAAPAARMLPRWATTAWAQLALCAASLLALGASTWLGNYDRSAATDTFIALVGVAVMGALWAGSWAVAGRIATHRFRFLGHCTVLALVVLVFWAWSLFNGWALFLFPDNKLPHALGTLLMVAGIAVLVAAHLALASSLSTRRRWQAGIVTSIVFSALMGIAALTERDAFSDIPEFDGTVKAVGSRWLPTHSVASFGATTSHLKREVDALLEK